MDHFKFSKEPFNPSINYKILFHFNVQIQNKRINFPSWFQMWHLRYFQRQIIKQLLVKSCYMNGSGMKPFKHCSMGSSIFMEVGPLFDYLSFNSHFVSVMNWRHWLVKGFIIFLQKDFVKVLKCLINVHKSFNFVP